MFCCTFNSQKIVFIVDVGRRGEAPLQTVWNKSIEFLELAASRNRTEALFGNVESCCCCCCLCCRYQCTRIRVTDPIRLTQKHLCYKTKTKKMIIKWFKKRNKKRRRKTWDEFDACPRAAWLYQKTKKKTKKKGNTCVVVVAGHKRFLTRVVVCCTSLLQHQRARAGRSSVSSANKNPLSDWQSQQRSWVIERQLIPADGSKLWHATQLLHRQRGGTSGWLCVCVWGV